MFPLKNTASNAILQLLESHGNSSSGPILWKAWYHFVKKDFPDVNIPSVKIDIEVEPESANHLRYEYYRNLYLQLHALDEVSKYMPLVIQVILCLHYKIDILAKEDVKAYETFIKSSAKNKTKQIYRIRELYEKNIKQFAQDTGMIENGASPFNIVLCSDEYEADNEFWPENQKLIIDELLKAGADPHAPNINGFTPFDFLLSEPSVNIDILCKLIEHAPTNRQQTEYPWRIPRMLVDRGDIDLIRALMQKYPQLDFKQYSYTLLHAIDNLDIRMVSFLLNEVKMDPNDMYPFKAQALHQVMKLPAENTDKAKKIAQLLIDSGAQLDGIAELQNGDGTTVTATPLMIAAASGNQECVTFLLQAGAESRYENDAGKTAYDYANDHFEVQVLLTQPSNKRRKN